MNEEGVETVRNASEVSNAIDESNAATEDEQMPLEFNATKTRTSVTEGANGGTVVVTTPTSQQPESPTTKGEYCSKCSTFVVCVVIKRIETVHGKRGKSC